MLVKIRTFQWNEEMLLLGKGIQCDYTRKEKCANIVMVLKIKITIPYKAIFWDEPLPVKRK